MLEELALNNDTLDAVIISMDELMNTANGLRDRKAPDGFCSMEVTIVGDSRAFVRVHKTMHMNENLNGALLCIVWDIVRLCSGISFGKLFVRTQMIG